MARMSRRQFVVRGTAAAVGGASVCGLTGCATFTKIGHTPPIEREAYQVEPPDKVTVVLGKSLTLAKTGAAVKIVDPALADPLIIAHVESGKFVVASLRCPHRGVELEYQPDKQRFCCASLGHSRFALDGRKLGGPAPRPIKVYPSSVADGILTIKLPA